MFFSLQPSLHFGALRMDKKSSLQYRSAAGRITKTQVAKNELDISSVVRLDISIIKGGGTLAIWMWTSELSGWGAWQLVG